MLCNEEKPLVDQKKIEIYFHLHLLQPSLKSFLSLMLYIYIIYIIYIYYIRTLAPCKTLTVCKSKRQLGLTSLPLIHKRIINGIVRFLGLGENVG